EHNHKHSPFFQTRSRALLYKYFEKHLADMIWKDAVRSKGARLTATRSMMRRTWRSKSSPSRKQRLPAVKRESTYGSKTLGRRRISSLCWSTARLAGESAISNTAKEGLW